MNLTPAAIRRRIAHRPNLVKVVDNISWLFLDRALRMGVGFFVGVWIARYLGPEKLGVLNYAKAFVAMFGAIAGLGLDAIVVRDLAKEPEIANATLGTAFILKLFGGLIAIALALGAIVWVRPDDNLSKALVAILGLSLIFKSSEVIKYWFQSQVQSRYTVWAESSAFLFGATLIAIMILSHAPVTAFAWVILVQAGLAALGLFGIYIKLGKKVRDWTVQVQRAKGLLQSSLPLIMAGSLISINVNIDKMMIGTMMNDKLVGIYSIPIQIYHLANSIIILAEVSFFPVIVQKGYKNKLELCQNISYAYQRVFFISLVFLAIFLFLARPLIYIIFGKAYIAGANVLSIYIFLFPLSVITRAQGQYFKIVNKTTMIMWRQLLIALLNVAGCTILIRKFGINGAATAILISFTIALFVFLHVGEDKKEIKYLTRRILGLSGYNRA